MKADRLHLARGTGKLRVYERDGAWFSHATDHPDPSVTPFERWFDQRFMPTLEGVGIWIVCPLIGWAIIFNVAREIARALHPTH